MRYQSLLIISQKDHNVAALEHIPFAKGERSPDILWVEGEPSIGIDAIKALRAKLHMAPFEEAYKVVVVLHAETATPEAQNALLKTLEEPPERTQVILVATSADSLLPTIVSRCTIVVEKKNEEGDLSEKNLPHIQELTIPESIALAEEYGERSKALKLVTSLLQTYKVLLEKNPNKQAADIVGHLITAHKRLKRNVNVRLTLESLFFSQI